ncbi:MAG: zf-TFIIB domain-containing protein [Candidatus Marinimicrobia bacterium]|nr:zf-TFIIB domain-containing protein [Candidatus Neomarinimicrobiota bacterium]
MKDAWEVRKKALENKDLQDLENVLIEKIKTDTREKLIRKYCHNRCPKCGDPIEPIDFRGVPMDRCLNCGGVWLGPNDLRILSEKDHRTWFDRWFKEETAGGEVSV